MRLAISPSRGDWQPILVEPLLRLRRQLLIGAFGAPQIMSASNGEYVGCNFVSERMLRRVFLFSAVAILGLATALSEADARRGGRAHVGGHRSAGIHRSVNVHRNVAVRRHVNLNRPVRRHVAVGHRYYGGIYYGHVRRYWRGRWWAYGVGSCWRLTPEGYYVWICF